MKAEYFENEGCLQRERAEREGHAGARSAIQLETGETESVEELQLLEHILDRNNLNRAYKRVKANKGAPGIDGMTVEDALPWLKEHKDELLTQLRDGKYKPSPVRRKEIPKPDGGVRKLGIPTVIDRIIQQAIAQVLMPIFEPKFSDGSYGYRPGRSAQQAIAKVREYAEQGYQYAVLLDLSKYFDTLQHERLLNVLRKTIKDERVIQLIKKYLKSGVMENGVVVKTMEGSPQGGNLSPLLANIYLDEFDHEFERRGVPVVRYADDIVLLAKSKRASERLLETSTRYLETKMRLTVNKQKSKAVSVYSIRNFKFLGFALGKGRNGVFIRVHTKSLKKAKDKLRKLTSRSRGRNAKAVMQEVKLFIRGWLNYFGIASMKKQMQAWDEWLRHRFRVYIWKQWKEPRTKFKNLCRLGVPKWAAYRASNCRRAYWWTTNTGAVKRALTNENLVRGGYYEISKAYEVIHAKY